MTVKFAVLLIFIVLLQELLAKFLKLWLPYVLAKKKKTSLSHQRVVIYLANIHQYNFAN